MPEPPGIPTDCSCLREPYASLTQEHELGMDGDYGEVSLWRCARCDRIWLRYLYELEAFSRSGRWYLGLLSDETATTVDAFRARETLERLDWYFYGGSYFDGRTGKASGTLA